MTPARPPGAAPTPLPLGIAPPDLPDLPDRPVWPVDTRPDPEGVVAFPDRLLPGFATNLFVQGYLDEAEDMARLVAHTGVGAVLTFERQRRRGTSLQRALHGVGFLRDNLAADVLVDRNLYSGGGRRQQHLLGVGSRRKTAADGLSRRWVEDQHRVLRLRWALTDTGYCGSLPDTARILAEAAGFGAGTVTLLPVPHQLLRDDAAGLADQVNLQPHPVALVLEHEGDPFDTAGVAAGAVHMLQRAAPPVLFLRCDTSALGLVSHGAAVGAVGTHSGLRHLFPVRDDDGGGHAERLAFVIPDLLG